MKRQSILFWTCLFGLVICQTNGSLSSGCGKSLSNDFSSGETTSIRINATNDQPVRHYKIHLPSNFNNNRGHAIVFSFHGHNGDMTTQEDLSQLSHKGLIINGVGIIAVYPQGKKGTDGGTAWQGAPYSDPNVDDIDFVKKMISQLEDMFCVDSSRIYATGKSNGGGFVNLLACTPSIADKFAAIAPVSAAFYTKTFNGNCSNECGTPILDFHGTNDTTISYDGGLYRNDTLKSIDQYRQEWAIKNGCQTNATISHPSQTIEIHTWNHNCNQGGIVIGYKIIGGQHAWPRTTLPTKCNGTISTSDCTLTVFNATKDVIIPFFNNFALQTNN